jgi:PAS domain S-box-containing protein
MQIFLFAGLGLAILVIFLVLFLQKLKEKISTLQNRKDEAESIYMKANDPLLVVNIVKGNILQVNDMTLNLLGYSSPEEMKEKTIFDIVPTRFVELSSERVADVWEKGGHVFQDVPFMDKKGNEIAVECSGRVLPFEKDPIMVLYLRDIRERLRMEREIKNQSEIIEQKNKDITDSIKYALRIQSIILPSLSLVKEHLPKSFIIYKPKDIVAGDFYWLEAKGEWVFFAACDCTGHGVPGAMVSVVCHNELNRAIREFDLLQPAAILDKVTELVTEIFTKSQEKIYDGMDISLCAYNSKTQTLQWAGANNPLWIISSGNFIVTKADKQSIGHSYTHQPFTNHEFQLLKGDKVYIFTDGFADQFGGEQEKKVTRKRFKDLIQSTQNESMQLQAAGLEKFLTEYKKGTEQTDDILVMGVEV